MSQIVINGITVANGSSVNIINGRVIVDGQEIAMTGKLADAKVFNIVVEGNVDRVDGSFANVEVKGSAGAVKTMSGDITVHGDVNGGAETMSGDVKVKGSIQGNVKTVSGDIRSK